MKVTYSFASFEVEKATRLVIGTRRLSIILSAYTGHRLYGIAYYGDNRDLIQDSRTVVAFPNNKTTRILQELDSIYASNFQARLLLGEEEIDRHLFHVDLNFAFYVKRAIRNEG